MRLLIITQYIYPETFKSSDLAFELRRRGHSVDVLTGIPNYPEGKYYDGYGLFRKRKEKKEGVSFYRCFQTPRKLLPGFLGLALNYTTFVVSSTLWVLFYFVWKNRYDAIITHEPSPITQIIPAIILSKIKSIPVYSWIMDIWPDSMTCHLSKPLQRVFYKPLNSITNWVYRNSEKILITSPGFADFVNRDADYSDKIVYYPNWSDDILEQNINDCDTFPSGYIIMMAGNIGSGLGIPAILSLFEECKYINQLHFVFVGGGSSLKEMEKFVEINNINNVHFLGRHPFEMMHTFYDRADAMFLTLAPMKHPFLQATIPARLQSYMSAAKPILAMIDGGAAELITKNDLGHCVHAGDYKSLAYFIVNELIPNKSEFAKKGINARKLYEREFTKEKCIDNLEKILMTLVWLFLL